LNYFYAKMDIIVAKVDNNFWERKGTNKEFTKNFFPQDKKNYSDQTSTKANFISQ